GGVLLWRAPELGPRLRCALLCGAGGHRQRGPGNGGRGDERRAGTLRPRLPGAVLVGLQALPPPPRRPAAPVLISARQDLKRRATHLQSPRASELIGTMRCPKQRCF